MTAVVAVLAAVAASWAGLRAFERARRRRRLREAGRALPGVVSDLARAVRGGATLGVALRDVATVVGGVLGAELRTVVALLDRGHPLDRVLDTWGRSSRVDGTDLLVAACRFSAGRSRALDRALDGVAAALLDRIEVADEVAALASQARTSAIVLVTLPPAGAALFSVLDPGFLPVLVGTTVGRLCLLIGLALDVAGAWSASALVRRAVR